MADFICSECGACCDWGDGTDRFPPRCKLHPRALLYRIVRGRPTLSGMPFQPRRTSP